MSHEKGGSYCIDSTGSFHFVKGYTGLAVGTEIVIRGKKPACLRRLMFLTIGLVAVFIIYSLACGFPMSGKNTDCAGVHYSFFCPHSLEYCENRCECASGCFRN